MLSRHQCRLLRSRILLAVVRLLGQANWVDAECNLRPLLVFLGICILASEVEDQLLGLGVIELRPQGREESQCLWALQNLLLLDRRLQEGRSNEGVSSCRTAACNLLRKLGV